MRTMNLPDCPVLPFRPHQQPLKRRRQPVREVRQERRYLRLVWTVIELLVLLYGPCTTQALSLESELSQEAQGDGSSSAEWENKDTVATTTNGVDGGFKCVLRPDDNSFRCTFTIPMDPTSHRHLNHRPEMKLHYCDERSGECVTGIVQLTRSPMDDTSDENLVEGWDELIPTPVSVIHVGERVYHAPFHQYGPNVEQQLRQYRGPYSNPLDEADWLLELGIAHRLEWEEGHRHYPTNQSKGLSARRVRDASVPNKQPTTRSTGPGPDIEPAINAFKQAIRIVQGIKNNPTASPEDQLEANLELASAMFQISESYATSNHFLAIEYMKQSEKLYRQLLSQSWPLDTVTHRNTILTRGLTLVRLGVLILEEPQATLPDVLDEAKNWEPIHGEMLTMDNLELLLQKNSQGETPDPYLEQIILQQSQWIANQAAWAEGYFREAVAVYQSGLDNPALFRGGDSDEHYQRFYYDMALALQNLATAANTRGDYETSVTAAGESVMYYQMSLDLRQLPADDLTSKNEVLDIVTATADLLFQLSDYHLKLGQYEKSKAKYRESLALYEQYHLSPPSVGSVLKGDASVDAYEQALEEYRAMLMEQPVEPEVEDENEEQPIPVQQDGYEGDLHMGLGSLYLAQGDLIQAASHLTQAMRLYQRSGEQGETNMGDVKFTLAEVYFKNGEFDRSVRFHAEALDIYRQAHGEDTNPLDSGVPKVAPTITFHLDPIEEDALTSAPTESSAPKQAITIEAKVSPTSPDVQTTVESHETQQDEPTVNARTSGEPHKVDPMSALMDYWYSTLAEESEPKEADDKMASPPVDEL